MANTRQIKGRINSAANISKITKAMEMVSASKMRSAQMQALAARPYTHAIQDSLHKVARFTDSSLHPLLSQHHEGKNVLIVFSTDRGLCGSLNTNLFKAAIAWAKHHDNFELIVIGKKAVSFAKKMGLPLLAQFTELPEKVSPADLLPVTELIKTGFLDHSIRSVYIVHMDFINTLSQKVKVTPLLPVSVGAAGETDGVKPAHAGIHTAPAASHSVTTPPQIFAEYIFEPNAAEILNELLPYYLESTIFQTQLEAKASEHSARMVSMKNASDNAKDLVGELKLQFNKSRQATITNELLDITTATLTVSN